MANIVFRTEGREYAGPGAKWQIVFKTKEGLDYCRETKGLTFWDRSMVEAFAKDQCAIHGLGGAVIEIY